MYAPLSINNSMSADFANVSATSEGMLDVGTSQLRRGDGMTSRAAPTGDNLERARNRQRMVSELTPKIFTGVGCDFAVQRALGSNSLDNDLPRDFDTMLSMVPGIKWQMQFSTSRVLVDFVDFKTEGLADVPVCGWVQDRDMLKRLKITEGGKVIDFHKSEAMLGAPLAKKLNKNVGDLIELYGNKFQVAGIYESPIAEENNGIIIYITNLQQMTDQEGELTGFGITAERPMSDQELEILRQHIAAIQPRLKVTRVPRVIGNDAGK
jgi:hypothetical protein